MKPGQIFEGNHRVTCLCNKTFCFKCYDNDVGDHYPLQCKFVKKWMGIEVGTSIVKQCPNCKLPGDNPDINTCKIMTCDPQYGGCGLEFCWKCLVLTTAHNCPNCKDKYYDDKHFTVDSVIEQKNIRATEDFGD